MIIFDILPYCKLRIGNKHDGGYILIDKDLDKI